MVQVDVETHLDASTNTNLHGVMFMTTPSNLKPKSNVTVLWTNTTTDPSKPITRTWTPNHFVLLATAPVGEGEGIA
jgi:hypothetical protein